ncbi:hypothetical protein JCM10450v2_003328 [Rhodotorula kratochvilovae]
MAASRPHPLPRLQSLPAELLANIASRLSPPLHALELAPQKWRATLQALEMVDDEANATRAKTEQTIAEIVRAGGALDVGFLFLEEYIAAMVKAPPLFPLVYRVHTVRLSVSSQDESNLSVFAGLPHLRRLSLHGCTLALSQPRMLPRRLDELELVGGIANEKVVDTLIKRNPLLRIVHVTDLERAKHSGDFYLPLDSLRACKNIELLQISVADSTEDEFDDSEIEPFAGCLLFHTPIGRAIPTSVVAHVRRIALGNQIDPYGDPITFDDLLRAAPMLAVIPHLAVVALPDSWRPSSRYGWDGQARAAVRLAVNTLVNACRRRGVRVVWFDEDLQLAGRRERVLYAVLEGEGVETCGGGDAGARAENEDDDELEEWPGSWEAFEERYGTGSDEE